MDTSNIMPLRISKMNSLAEQIIVQILVNQMALDDQTCWVRDQNKKIPNGDGLFIVVGMVDSQVLSVGREEVSGEIPQPSPAPALQTLTETMTVITRDNIQIDIMSRDNQALLRRWEILAALQSTYAVQQMEENDFRIFRQPMNFVNASAAEGGSTLNRFSMTIPCNVWYRKESVSPTYDFYNSFDTRVDDEQSIGTADGIIEFTIDENTTFEGA